MSVEIKEVSKFYGKQNALDNVSFKINTGEIVAFIGPNGAGKTTLMKIITGFIPQSSGEVFVNGLNIAEHPLEAKEKIGYLPKNNPLYLDMYVKEYLEFVAGMYKKKNIKKERIEEMIQKTGLSNEQSKKIKELSKGYRQRVGLAQALIHNPEVLILDEPTSGLDPNQIVEIRNLISELGKEKTVMLSTHIMQEVEAICHKVVIINNGKIVADDLAKDLHLHTSEEFLTIIVEFDKNVAIEALKNIKGVLKVAKVQGNSWLIQCQKNDDIRPLVFNFAVKNNFTVLSMQKKEKSLEAVFQELTR